MAKVPGDMTKPDASMAPDGEPVKKPPVKPKLGHGLPMTKAERSARMRADKMVIKRMRKR